MNTRIIPNKAFSDWYDGLPDGEPSYQQTFEAGQKASPRGYALLGTGLYAINHSSAWSDELGAELVITIATNEEKSGNRQIGETRPNPDDMPPIQPEDMVIRIGFLSERALFALEEQLRFLRETHFKESA